MLYEYGDYYIILSLIKKKLDWIIFVIVLLFFFTCYVLLCLKYILWSHIVIFCVSYDLLFISFTYLCKTAYSSRQCFLSHTHTTKHVPSMNHLCTVNSTTWIVKAKIGRLHCYTNGHQEATHGFYMVIEF